jgi:hypothetical protein
MLVFTVFHYMFRPTWPSSCVSELYCVGFHCLSLHVSAYTAYVADKHIRKKTTTKTMKENSTGTKHKWKSGRVWTREKRAEKSREAESFENKISYTHEDGHVGRNMWWKTVENQHNKAARRRKHKLQHPSDFVATDPEISDSIPGGTRRSVTGSTEHHEYNWGATWKKK